MSTKRSTNKKNGKSRRSKTLIYSGKDNNNRKLYALAVDKYFSSVPDKDKKFKSYNPKEEREIIEKYRNDRQTLENLLTEHNIFFALNYASQQAYRFDDYDELISLAMNGLRAAATTFDVDKGYRFNTWAAFYLKKFILRKFYVKKESMIDNNVGIYLDSNVSTVTDDNDSEYMYSTLKSHVEPLHEEPFNNTFVNKIEDDEKENKFKTIAHKIIESVEMSSLSNLDKKIFGKSFIDGLTIQKISKELGVSRNVVTEGKTRVLSYINSNFSKSEIFS